MKKLSFILLILTSLNVKAGTGWTIEKYEDGIKVYTRKVDGWDVEEFKAYATIDAPREKVREALLDIADFVKWFPDVDESAELSRSSYENRVIYYKIDLPWPADDRDIVLNYTVKNDEEKNETIISMKENLTAKSKVDGVIRMTKTRGFWILKSNGNKTDIHYQVLADPGGSMPTWLINMFIVDGPYDTIMALRKRVKQI
ncbi:START domain-containing protein [Paracrocinitomix mangrovi]|uniref:START domain-containing protein n=1 Tax=Paracrocinitomix mangrovi TaxID=2862509 RepID=UPI001C8DA4FB|nr:START domain-containing protein [Paracrocinitomix mangrovi]UKN01953.1 START domain-containing protein [Paracrocinitomix mangrovi]